jgi:4-amino-4-deoxy-L-arabinose transferase-like glycosyltransferase
LPLQSYSSPLSGFLQRPIALLKRLPPLVLLTAISLIARLFRLGIENLWYDESYTAWIAKLANPAAVVRAAQSDVHPPLWYLIEWANVRLFGSSEWALRLPSALFGIGVVLLVWLLARQMGLRRRTAFTAGMLTAFLPGALYYSQEARGYSLLTCAVIGLTIAAMSRNWLLFVVCGVIASYTHNLGVLYVAALGGYMIVTNLRTGKPGWPLVASATVALLWLPWLPTVLHQMAGIASGFWLPPVDLGMAIAPLATMTLGWRMHEYLAIMFWPVAFAISGAALFIGRTLLLTDRGRVLCVAIGAAPALGYLYSALAGHNVYLARAFLPSIVALIPLWAYALEKVNHPNRVMLKLAIIPALAVGVAAQYYPFEGKQNTAALMAPVREQWQEGDVLYFSQISPAIQAVYYAPGRLYALEPDAGDLNQMLTDEGKAAMGFRLESWLSVTQHYKRAWVVLLNNGMTTIRTQQLRDWIVAHGELAASYGRDQVGLVELWRVTL